MPEKKKRLQQASCFMMGLIGAVFSAGAGASMALSLGPALLLRAISFAMTGAMLLFLALAMQGAAHKAERVKLLGLFFLLVVSYFNLPPLSTGVEMLVIFLLGMLFRKVEDGLCLTVLGLSELACFFCRTAGLTSLFAPWTPQVVGLGLVVASAARFWVLYRLHRRA